MGTHPIFESDFDCLTELEMSKRAPGSTLTQDNWDNEDKNEEQGNWTKAKESTLKQRVIMKAKRRGVTSSDSSSKGIGSAFGGFGAKMATSKPSAGFAFDTKKEDKKDEENEIKNDKKVKTSDDEVIRLNKSLLEWCKAHLEKDPVCDFRPVFDDYKKHMDKIDKMYGHKWVDMATPSDDRKNGTSEPEVKKPSFSFGKSEDKKEDTSKPSFSFGSSSTEKKEDEKSKPMFSFGKTEAKSEEKKESPSFSFSSKKEDEKKEPPKFSFGGSSDSTIEAPKFGFAAKSDDKGEPPKPAGGFFANLGGSKPASSGFSFGSSSGTSSAAFTFAPTATGSSAATSASSTKEDEEYVPPVAETKEFDDAKDALYQKKSKIFYLKDGNYKEIGVGLLFIKPLENDKASILVRADNTLGNILLNVAIPPSPAPVKQGKNNCLLPVVLNPPIEGVEGAVPLLIRVKTSDDADELIEIIKSKQS